MRISFRPILLLVLLSACGDSTAPSATPEPGRYRYAATYTGRGGGTFGVRAVLVVNHADKQRIDAQWEPTDDAFWSVRRAPAVSTREAGEYVVYGDVFRVGDVGLTGIAVLRVAPGASPRELSCAGHILHNDGNFTHGGGTCTLQWLGK